MKAGRVFALSLLLNLALMGWLAARLAAWPRPGAVPEERHAIGATPAAGRGEPDAATNRPVAAVAYLTNRFHWRLLETNDLAQLAGRLRAVGCPEQTVHELVMARAVRAVRQLEDTTPRLPFWTAGNRRAQIQREAARQALASQERILTELEQALGPGAFPENPKWKHDLVEQALLRFLTGPMSEESLGRMQQAFARFEAHRDAIHLRADGILLEEDEAAVAQAQRQFQAELRAAFSPAEFEEFTARIGLAGFMDEVCFEALDLSLAEIRQLGLLRGRHVVANLEGSLDNMRFPEEQEAVFKDELRRWLGQARYAQFERAADHEFRPFFELGKDHQLPRQTAEGAYELRQLTARQVAALRADTSLPEAERRQRLAEVQAQAQEAMLRILGASACQQYLQRGGEWMTNVAGL